MKVDGGARDLHANRRPPFAANLRSSNDPVAWRACAARGDLRIGLAGVQGPQHGDVGHHNNAALLGGRDQKFHCDLPMLALGFGRRQRKDINASIA